MKHAVLIVLFSLLSATLVYSQHSSNAYRAVADSLYRHHHYQFAADYYEKALKKATNPGAIMLQLGKCYDKVNKPLVAEQWFRMAAQKDAPFTDEDYYLYAEALIAQKKYQRADSLLAHIVTNHPEMVMAQTALHDIREMNRFYADSALTKIAPLSLNTDVAEFSAVRYKDGLVFTSARQEGALKKKYHWDNSHFLNLYYARRTETGLTNAELFEKTLNTRHHDGPASFYDGFQKMIFNRNQRTQAEGREEVFELRPGLYDAVFNSKKSDWIVTPLPFNNPLYSYAHPSVSEDGNTLYFSSDMPGGYGGMDLYRVTRTNGRWGTPFNLGPAINTIEDEVFPFFVNSTLYFSSNGHGGLGGLDIFISHETVNGFGFPENAGYPINSFSDDLSYTTDSLQREGYFASARSGNDDLYSFKKVDLRIKLMAHIYDGETKQPLPGAHIQVITQSNNDDALVADQQGNFSFEVPKDEPYVVVGTLDDYVGMVADVADSAKFLRIPAYRDTTRIACLGFVIDELGLPQTAAVINITDMTTGKTIPHTPDQSIISFLGEKGHEYHIEAIHSLGHKASQVLPIAKGDKGVKKFTIVLPNTPPSVLMAGRAFKADDNQPVAQADIRVLTFGEEDQRLTTGNDGVVDFRLAQGQAYVVIATKEGLSGMLSGVADMRQRKDVIIHPIPMYGDKSDAVLAMGLITNKKGQAIDGFKATVTNARTGSMINSQSNRGLLTFQGHQGGSFDVKLEHDDYQTVLAEVNIPPGSADVYKFSLIMDDRTKGGNNQQIAPLLLPATAPTTLLFVDTEDGKSKAFISTNNQLTEVKEKQGELTVRQGKENRSLGKGTLAELRTQPEKVLSQRGLSNVSPILLRTVYFDFDKHDLDEEDIARLNDVKRVLDNQPGYQLTISGHADDRGNENYNERLSRRRAQAVYRYLVTEGLSRTRIIMKAYGEARPAIPCMGSNCTEDDHRLNRRAEFLLQGSDEQILSTPDTQSGTATPLVASSASTNIQMLVRQHGDKTVEGISYRISIGAYRKKHDLTFPELAGIGTVESVSRNGVTYYYLTSYSTLAAAEQARQQAVQRGIPDAAITAFKDGEKIAIEELAGIMPNAN